MTLLDSDTTRGELHQIRLTTGERRILCFPNAEPGRVWVLRETPGAFVCTCPMAGMPCWHARWANDVLMKEAING